MGASELDSPESKASSPGKPDAFDVLVVGAGFGGLATALILAESGARVAVFERLDYPGGCASTFTRDGFSFEAGATLFSGFAPGHLFDRWVEAYELPVVLDRLDPVVELRWPHFKFPIPGERQGLIDFLTHLPGAPVEALLSFFRVQGDVADTLWNLLGNPDRIPPCDFGTWLTHLKQAPSYLRLTPYVGRPLAGLLERLGLDQFEPFMIYLDAICQITVQCAAKEADALFALGTMDYFFRGTGHIRGGIGTLAWGLVEAIRQKGGEVRFTEEVRSISRESQGWRVESRGGVHTAETVVANLLPQNVIELTGARIDRVRDLVQLSSAVEEGWGAAMLYQVRSYDEGRPERGGPFHVQLIADPAKPLKDGNHIFCSFGECRESDESEGGVTRSLTISTHLSVAELRSLTKEEQAEYISSIQSTMRETIARLTRPEEMGSLRVEHTASPRTFQRFTKRFVGYVGGIPRKAGFHNYRGMKPRALAEGLYLVGDTVFPGQSTFATAIGGYKLGRHLAHKLAR